jgi:hypothetical protein
MKPSPPRRRHTPKTGRKGGTGIWPDLQLALYEARRPLPLCHRSANREERSCIAPAHVVQPSRGRLTGPDQGSTPSREGTGPGVP